MGSVPALSYSSYRTYLECPLRWKYLYVDHRPELPRGYFTFGRVVHSVLEELLRPFVVPDGRRATPSGLQQTLDAWGAAVAAPVGPPRWMSREEMLAEYDRQWLGDGYTSAEEEARYRALGRDLLGRYYDRLIRDPPRPVAVEEHLEARWGGIPIHGYLDRVDRTPNDGLEIVDYKTTRELSVDDARESDQLSIYQVLVENNYRAPVEKLTLFHLRSMTPLRTAPRSADSLEPLHQRMGAVADGIREEAFDPTPGRHCSRCDFQSICPEFKTVSGKEGDRLATLVDRFESLRAQEHQLQGDLARTAEELHRAAEELGVHRVRGTRAIAVRRREEAWQYSLDSIRPLLNESGMSVRLGGGSPEEVRRLLQDTEVSPELRRRVAETGSRRVRWYWELDGASGRSGDPNSS